VQKIADRERAPMYTVGETTGDARFAFEQADGVRPFDLAVDQMFGSSPKTYMVDKTVENEENLKGCFIGPRREMITPWSTNAVEITQNMGLTGVLRIEEYFPVKDENAEYDPMLQRMYKGLNQEIFTVNIKPQPIVHIENLEEYNEKEGLALSREEMDYLLKVEKDLGRKLTDSEVFGFAQINSEHCRHKIFGGTFIIDGQDVTMTDLVSGRETLEDINFIVFCGGFSNS
jgi:phosphoribosylformylglycinamidine (FGAM) synthase-like enzyme